MNLFENLQLLKESNYEFNFKCTCGLQQTTMTPAGNCGNCENDLTELAYNSILSNNDNYLIYDEVNKQLCLSQQNKPGSRLLSDGAEYVTVTDDFYNYICNKYRSLNKLKHKNTKETDNAGGINFSDLEEDDILILNHIFGKSFK